MKTKLFIKYIFTCVAAGLMLVACSDDSDEQQDNVRGVGVVYGRITDDASNEPVQGANVTIYPGGKTVVTGQDGHYEFTGLTTGGYIVQLSKNGYLSQVEAPVVTTTDVNVQADASLHSGESCLDILLGELDFGNNSSAKTFVISNKGNKTIHWNLYSDYHSFLYFDKTEGALGPTESVAVNVNLIRSGTSAELNSFPIYIQADGEELGAIATINRYAGGKLNSLLVGTWALEEQSFWQKDIDDITYNKYPLTNSGFMVFHDDYTYEDYERQFIYSQNVENADNMFNYEYETGNYSYDQANGVLQLGEYGRVFHILNLNKEYLELEQIVMQGQKEATILLLKRI